MMMIMKRTAQIVLIITLLGFPIVFYGQQANVDSLTQESKVVLAEEDVSSLIKILLKYKQDKKAAVQEETVEKPLPVDKRVLPETDLLLENARLKLQLSLLQDQLMKAQGSPAVSSGLSERLEDQSREIRNMQYEISRIQDRLLQQATLESSPQAVVMSPGNSVLPESLVVSPVETEDPAISILQNKVDSLLEAAKQSSPQTPVDYSHQLDSLQHKIADLRMEMDSKKISVSEFDALKAQFRGFKKVIYFENNSTGLRPEGKQEVRELVHLLGTNQNLDLVLVGFASNKGGAAYNENLSMQRTEAIKRALVVSGLAPTRVLTQYHGIDY
jgi:outer membrane protein OmpA-like peptidoglycan-associated protein